MAEPTNLRIFALRSPATVGGAAVEGCLAAKIDVKSIRRTDPGSALARGPAKEITTYRRIEITLMGVNFHALAALDGAAAAVVVLPIYGADGAARKITTGKSVSFGNGVSADVFRPDQGGEVNVSSITGVIEGAVAADTLATLLAETADA
jgi:hypothetical protein